MIEINNKLNSNTQIITKNNKISNLIIRIFILLCILITIGIISSKSKGSLVQQSQLNQNLIEYNYGPQSVAIGDFNNDNWVDIVIANSIRNNIEIYFGSINQTFSKPFQYSTGLNSYPIMIAVDDLNDDFYLDIAVANYGRHSIGIFYGLNNGLFRKQIEISTGISRPLTIHLIDVNNDEFCDIIIINYGMNSFSIYYGIGNELFSKSETYSTGYNSHPYSLTIGDLNNDDRLDIIITNYRTNNIALFYSNQNHSFENPMFISTGINSQPTSVAVGDLNSDEFIDLVVTNYGTKTICILLNNRNGSFLKQRFYSTGSSSPYSIVIDDLNGDKQLDLFIINIGKNNIGSFLGYGNGSFEEGRMDSTASFSSISFALCDYNKDNQLDVIIVNNDTRSIDIIKSFSNHRSYNIRYPSRFGIVGDTMIIRLEDNDGSYSKTSNILNWVLFIFYS